MSIYTRTGDKGETSLYGGKRVLKSSSPVAAYGSIDELTSFIGLVIAKLKSKEDKVFLTRAQKDLYLVMSKLSGAPVDISPLEKTVFEFERRIDEMEQKLPKLTRFILPQGTGLSSWFHVLRVVCRRAERSVIATRNNQPVIIKYVNRLSDLFFTYARWYNKGKEIKT